MALRRLYQSQPAGKKAIRNEYFNLLGLGFFVGGLILLCFWLAERRLPIVVMAPVSLGVFALWFHSHYKGLQDKADQVFLRAAGTSASGDHVMTLSDQGIHEERPSGTIFHRWEALHDVVDTSEHIFVFPDSGTYIVPKRAFSGPEAAASFVAELRRRVESSPIQ